MNEDSVPHCSMKLMKLGFMTEYVYDGNEEYIAQGSAFSFW